MELFAEMGRFHAERKEPGTGTPITTHTDAERSRGRV